MVEIKEDILGSTAVIIAAYNAEKYLAKVVEDTSHFIERNRIIVVDDGSIDSTPKIAEDLGVLLIKHAKNLGKGAALLTGTTKAYGLGMDFVITLDADGQHNPAEIPKFIEMERGTGADIIIGNRMHDTSNMPFIRIFTNWATSLTISLRTGAKITDSQSGYRMMSTSFFNKLHLVTKRYDTESEILIKSALEGARIESVNIETIYREEKSSINPVVDTWRFLRMVFRSFFW